MFEKFFEAFKNWATDHVNLAQDQATQLKRIADSLDKFEKLIPKDE